MSALSALLVFLISFMIVAVFFKMPVSFALGTSSLLVLGLRRSFAHAGAAVCVLRFGQLRTAGHPVLHLRRRAHGVQRHLQNAD